MENKSQQQWIFYLKLTKDLPPEYLRLDHEFKKTNKVLVPINLKTLMEHAKKNTNLHVLFLVKSISEYNYFNNKVKKVLKFLLIGRRVHLYIGSSFSAVNDSSIMKRDYYYYARLPVAINKFCQAVRYEIDRKETTILKWPGGIRPKFSFVSGQ